MSKKIVSLCLLPALVAAASGSARAATTPTVEFSGLIDIGVYRDVSDKWNVGPIQRSNLAVALSQAINADLTAVARLSMRFDTGNGDKESSVKPIFQDEATVGLSSKQFGTLKFGRRLDAMYNNDWQFDPWYYFDRVASPAWDLWHYNFPSDPTADEGTPDYGRLNNGLFYDSPTIAGFSLSLSGSPQTTSTTPRKALGATLQFKNDLFQAMVAHERNSQDDTDTFIGLKTTIQGVALMGAHDVSKAGSSTARATTLGASYDIQQATLRAGWGQIDVDGVKVEKTVGLGAVYKFTPQFSSYVDYGYKKLTTRTANSYGVGLAYSF